MLEVSDLVTVGSVEQRSEIALHHNNVVIVRDFFDGDTRPELLDKAKELDRSVINILWEGFSHGSLSIFRRFRKIAGSLDPTLRNVNLHVVTDSKICGLMGKFFCVGTERILTHLFRNTKVKVKFYHWTIENINKAASQCDFAIILIPDSPFMQSKPENKLLFCWSLGLPTLTSDTPSYSRVMRDSGNLDCALNSDEEWVMTINKFSDSKERRDSNIVGGLEYIKSTMSFEIMLATWRSIFSFEK